MNIAIYFKTRPESMLANPLWIALLKRWISEERKKVIMPQRESVLILKKREDFIAAIEAKDPRDFIFIDESGSDTTETSEFGRVEGGGRLNAPKPAGTWKRFTIIGAISLLGVVAMMYGEWATDSNAFIAFVKNCLLKTLKKGQIVFLDNAKFHKPKIIQELIKSADAKVVFLPPYSPDLSPIEKMWSKIKHYIKKSAPRNSSDFHKALVFALSKLEEDDFEEWYEACGYEVVY